MTSDNRWFIPGKASVLVGGQFGSEAKGLAAAYMAEANKAELNEINMLVATTNAGAQAGHTTVYANGDKFVCFHLPTTGVVIGRSINEFPNLNLMIYVNSGAILDLDTFQKELDTMGLGPRAPVYVSPFAAVINDEARQMDADPNGPAGIASTGKGVGGALANKILRRRKSVMEDTNKHAVDDRIFTAEVPVGFNLMQNKAAVIVEIPQGTGLSINSSGFFPHTTSRECWVMQGLTDAGIHANQLGKICMVARTFPIRVGNTDKGNSGDFWHDSDELFWDDFPGVEPERTTVTKRIRRIATFSYQQYRHALLLNQPDTLFFSFINYLKTPSELGQMTAKMAEVESKVGISPTKVYSWGPCVEDVGNFRQAMAWLRAREALTVEAGTIPIPETAPVLPPKSAGTPPADVETGDGSPRPRDTLDDATDAQTNNPENS